MKTVAILPGPNPFLPQVIEAAGAKLNWESIEGDVAPLIKRVEATLVASPSPLPDDPLTTALGLHSRVAPCRSADGEVDVVLVWGTGLTMDRDGAWEPSHAASRHAAMQARRRVTIVTDPSADKLFQEVALDVAKDYPAIPTDELTAGDAARELKDRSYELEVLVCTAAVAETLVPLAADPDLTAVGWMGENVALFRPLASEHRPIAAIYAAGLFLEHLNEHQACDRIRKAADQILEEKPTGTPNEIAKAILAAIGGPSR